MENDNILNKLKYNINTFKALYINLSENPVFFTHNSQSNIRNLLAEIDKKLLLQDLKTIIIIINISFSNLIPYFTENNYKFHHTENNNLFLIKYIHEAPTKYPNYASHQVGVGAFIINESNKVLFVKEKIVQVNILKGKWKLPTGRIEKGETISNATEREVFEETRLKVKFEGITFFRETYPALFDCTDLFFVCVCSCNDSDTRKINLDIDDELMETKWFTKEEIIKEIKSFSDQNMLKYMLNIWPDKMGIYIMKGEEYKFLNRFKMLAYKPIIDNTKF